MTRGDALGSSTTNEDGFFVLTPQPYNGDVLLVAAASTYAEEALPRDADGNARRLALDRDFLGVALNVVTGQPATANITPVSHLAVHLARFRAKQGEDGHQAWVDAFADLGSHFGNGSSIRSPLVADGAPPRGRSRTLV